MRCLQVLPIPLLILLQASAWAQPRQDVAALRAAASQYLSAQVASAYPEAHSEISIGPVDPRLNLTPCSNLGFALPAGSNPWGSGNLRASCTAPSPWSLYLTYRVRLTGPALLAKRPLAVGEHPGPGDLETGMTEYAGDPGRYPKNQSELRNAALTRPLAKSHPVTIDMLRVPAIIKAGQKVRIVVDGNGFQINQEGVAQAQAGSGDTLRLKTPSGRFVQGTVQADGSVRIRP